MDTQFLAYKKLIENENRIGKSNIRLRNLYKISQYKYADGKSRNLADGKAAYVFIFGSVGDTIHGVKLNSVHPRDFMGFLSKLKDKNANIDDSLHLDEILKNFGSIKSDDGTQVYKLLKSSPKVYSKNYRTYKLNSLTYISEVFLQKEVLKQYFAPGQSRQERKEVITEEIKDDDID
jgi:hypothetical protein